MADPLISLARLRRQAVDEARKTLAGCLDLETAAERRAAAGEAAIALEMQAVSDLSAGDHAVESFGAWLRQARTTAAAARLEHQRAAADNARARAGLIAARAAAEAVETLLARQAAEAATTTLKRQQAELDEISRHRSAHAGRTRPPAPR